MMLMVKSIPSDGEVSSIPKLFKELMKEWGGFTQTREEADEDFSELERSLMLVNPKSYISLSKTTQLRTLIIRGSILFQISPSKCISCRFLV
jgi:hypothetical protein